VKKVSRRQKIIFAKCRNAARGLSLQKQGGKKQGRRKAGLVRRGF
jgi:hypothetical protein